MMYLSKEEEYADRALCNDGCWAWNGGHSNGYPQFSSKGTVHVWVLERKIGRRIRQGYEACHTCDNKWCCNPEHIYEGSRSENVLDAMHRGTTKQTRTVRRIERGIVYSLRSPQGEAFIDIRDFPDFCRRNGLTQGCARQVAIGERLTHKGWTKH